MKIKVNIVVKKRKYFVFIIQQLNKHGVGLEGGLLKLMSNILRALRTITNKTRSIVN